MNVRSPAFPVAWAALACLILTTACASSGERERGDSDARSGAASQVVTRDEILAGSSRNAWEALRDHVKFIFWREDAEGEPQLATRRGNTSMMGPANVRVVVDGTTVVNLRDLQLIPVRNLEEIRVLSAVDATTYFGTNSVSGAVVIRTRN